MTTDYERFRDESQENANLLAIEELLLEVDDLLLSIHECALAQHRVRERHSAMPALYGGLWCRCCHEPYPCPTRRDLEGPQLFGDGSPADPGAKEQHG